MASKIKVDQIQTADGTGTIALQNQLSGLTSASMPTGSVLQVKTSGPFSNSETTSSSFVDTGMSVSITPISTSSKILLVGSAFVLIYGSSSDLRMGVKIMRSSTAVWNSAGGRETFQVRGSPAEICSVVAINALDSPSSTSEVTYMTQIAKNNSGITACRLFANTQGSYLTAIEIAG